MTTDSLCKLSLVESRPSLQLIMSLVTSQGVHLELEQVNLRNIRVVLGRVTSIIACLPLPFVPNTLNEVLVKITNIQMSHTFVDVQLQLLLRDALLDPLAEGRVAGGAHAAVPVVDEAAALAVKGGGGRPIPAVLLGADQIGRAHV